jgi:hypothetical protein
VITAPIQERVEDKDSYGKLKHGRRPEDACRLPYRCSPPSNGCAAFATTRRQRVPLWQRLRDRRRRRLRPRCPGITSRCQAAFLTLDDRIPRISIALRRSFGPKLHVGTNETLRHSPGTRDAGLPAARFAIHRSRRPARRRDSIRTKEPAPPSMISLLLSGGATVRSIGPKSAARTKQQTRGRVGSVSTALLLLGRLPAGVRTRAPHEQSTNARPPSLGTRRYRTAAVGARGAACPAAGCASRPASLSASGSSF